MIKIFDFLSVSTEWSQMYFYIFIYMFHSIELMMSIDRELYELHTGNNTNTVVLLFFLVEPVWILFEWPTYMNNASCGLVFVTASRDDLISPMLMFLFIRTENIDGIDLSYFLYDCNELFSECARYDEKDFFILDTINKSMTFFRISKYFNSID
jgi:hypothetical protein